MGDEHAMSPRVRTSSLLLLAVFSGLGVGPGLNAHGTEAFVTEIRAHVSAIVGNGFAGLGGLAGPALIGTLGDVHVRLGSVGRVCLLAPLILVALPLVWLFVPEARDLSLQESESWSAGQRTGDGGIATLCCHRISESGHEKVGSLT
jgi:MFS family permease